MPIKEYYVRLLQFGKGLIFMGTIHFIPSQWDFFCFAFYLLFSLSLAPYPKVDQFWLIHTDQLRGAFLHLSVLIHAKSQRKSDFQRAGESALLEACAVSA